MNCLPSFTVQNIVYKPTCISTIRKNTWGDLYSQHECMYIQLSDAQSTILNVCTSQMTMVQNIVYKRTCILILRKNTRGDLYNQK